MNHKERIDAVMNSKQVDRTPFALVDGGAWIAQIEGKSYRELYHMQDAGASVIVNYMDEIDADMVSGVSGVFTACLNAFGCDIDIDTVGSPVNTDACIKDPENEIPALDKNDIREKLLANDFVQCMLKQCENVKRLVGDDKYVYVDIAGPFTMACVMAGTSKYMKMLLKKKELAAKMFDYAKSVSEEILRLLREKGADIAFIAEPCASGNMISPKMMDEWVVPGLKHLMDHLDYKYYISHICGSSGNRVIPVKDAGVNAFSCDYLVDLEQALTDADGQIALFGNLNPTGNLMMGTPEEVYEEACERIRTAAGRPFILAPGCDLGSKAPMQNVKMMAKACKDKSQGGK